MKDFISKIHKKIGVVILILVVIAFWIYLREYRLDFCEAVAHNQAQTIMCINEPLYKFILR